VFPSLLKKVLASLGNLESFENSNSAGIHNQVSNLDCVVFSVTWTVKLLCIYNMLTNVNSGVTGESKNLDD
jgi:hypothetical protein